MAEKKTINTLISLAVICLIVAALIGALATESQNRTTKTHVLSEVHNVLPTIATGRNTTVINSTIVYTLTNYPTTWEIEDCPITNFVLKNSTGDSFTVTTDYVLTDTKGTFTLVNSATALATLPLGNNNTYADYDYCGEGYINSSWGRSLLNMAPGFIALALLVAVIAGAYYLLERKKDED